MKKDSTIRIWIRRIALVATILVGGTIYYDYHRFHESQREIREIVIDCGGETRALLGWPIGIENYFRFRQPLSDDCVEKLSKLPALGYKNMVVISLDYDVTRSRLDELNEKIGVPVSAPVSDDLRRKED